MPDRPANSLLRFVRRLAADCAVRDVDDGELLGRFISSRDDEAFEMLVRRHGRLVRDICRRHLHDPNDADDAFQATFLVLAQRRPRSAGATPSLAGCMAWP